MSVIVRRETYTRDASQTHPSFEVSYTLPTHVSNMLRAILNAVASHGESESVGFLGKKHTGGRFPAGWYTFVQGALV